MNELSPRKPRIAIFASFSGQGGVEHMLCNLAGGMLAAGVEVDLVLARAQGEHLRSIPAGVNVVRLEVKHTLMALPRLARYLRETRPDALLAAKERAIRVAIVARWLSGWRGPLAGRLGTTVSAALIGKSWLRRTVWFSGMRLFHPRMDAIIAVSQGVKDDILSITGLPPDAVTVIPNPVITPALADKAAEPVEHAWLGNPQVPVIMGMGRLTRQKGFPDLIRAFAKVRAQRPCKLIIIGEGVDRAKLETLAHDLGVDGDIDLIGYRANPHALLAHASLFVLSSLWEGSPNALTEALALGIPVVSTNCPSGPDEILVNGKYGPLVTVGDVDGLAAAMLRTLDNPQPAALLREAVAEYTAERSARRYLAALGVSVLG
jgi:glycosyltransferase involved in cell wall biosynthesis